VSEVGILDVQVLDSEEAPLTPSVKDSMKVKLNEAGTIHTQFHFKSNNLIITNIDIQGHP